MARKYDFVLFHSDSEEDLKMAQEIQSKLDDLGMPGILGSDLLPGKSMLQGPMEFMTDSSIIFFLLTDSLASDKQTILYKDEAIMNQLISPVNNKLIIPLLLTEKKNLKQHDNVAFAGLMSRTGIIVNGPHFQRQVESLKVRLEKSNQNQLTNSSNIAIHSGTGNKQTTNCSNRKIDTDRTVEITGFKAGTMNTEDVDDNETASSEKRKRLDVNKSRVKRESDCPEQRSGGINSDNYSYGDSEPQFLVRNSSVDVVQFTFTPQYVLKFTHEFHCIQVTQINCLLNKAQEEDLLTEEECQRLIDLSKSYGIDKVKEELLLILVNKSEPLSITDMHRFHNLILRSSNDNGKGGIHRSSLRVLGGLLQLKIQNHEDLLYGLWAGNTITTDEKQQCLCVQERSGDMKANQKLIKFMLEKEEKLIERFVKLTESKVSAECWGHVSHTVTAFANGEPLLECCAKFEVMSADQIDDAISGPLQKSLKKHIVDLKQHFSDSEEVINHLWSRAVLSLSQRERLQMAKPPSQSVSWLIDELYKLDEEHVEIFVEVLSQTTGANPYLAECIRSSAKNMIQ